jgi:hypothetical protein
MVSALNKKAKGAHRKDGGGSREASIDSRRKPRPSSPRDALRFVL